MDLREAAEALGVHYQTAYAWARDGTLPARKAGRGYEVSDAGVQARRGAAAARIRAALGHPRPGLGSPGAGRSIRRSQGARKRGPVIRYSGWCPGYTSLTCASRSSRRRCAGLATSGRLAGSPSPRSTGPAQSANGCSPRRSGSRRGGPAARRSWPPRPGNGTACPCSWPLPAFGRIAGSSITWPATFRRRRSPGSRIRSAPAWSSFPARPPREPGARRRRRGSSPPAART